MGRVFFDYKPVILKAWHDDMEINKDDIQKIPIWVQLDLHFKYWGEKCLERIIQPVGNLLKVDSMTANRDKLQYARCMIEVKMDQSFPDQVRFKNEKDQIINVGIKYEWRPEICKKCKKVGHNESNAMSRIQRRDRPWQQNIGRSNSVSNNQEKSVNCNTKNGTYAGKEHQSHGLADTQAPQTQQGIVLAWNPNSFTLGLERMTDQVMHCVIKPSSGLPEFFCSFIYAHNDGKLRESLWQDLINISSKQGGPWLLMGDFNCVIAMEERIGSIVRQREMESMRNCIGICNIQDIPYSGHFYTWSNKQMAEDRVWSKLDRIMANDEWMNFDVGMGRKPFKYFKMWQLAPDYTERIKKAWGTEMRGTAMYKIVQKLKKVKASMKDLNKHGFNDMQAEDSKRYQEMVEIQEKLHGDPMNVGLMEEEKEATQQYHLAHKKYILFLKQKAKVAWLREGMIIQPYSTTVLEEEMSKTMCMLLKTRQVYYRILQKAFKKLLKTTIQTCWVGKWEREKQ
ncbi:Centromere protein I [Bienertia sinuspersici]